MGHLSTLLDVNRSTGRQYGAVGHVSASLEVERSTGRQYRVVVHLSTVLEVNRSTVWGLKQLMANNVEICYVIRRVYILH